MPFSFEKAEIIFNQGRPRRWVGPRKKLSLVRSLLTEMGFKPVEESYDWREVAKKNIEKHGESGVMIKGSRVKEGMTQAQLAKCLKIQQSHVSEMEHGSRSIGKNMAKKLAKIFNTDYRVFL